MGKPQHHLDEVNFERPPFGPAEKLDAARYMQPSPSFGGMSAGFYQSAHGSAAVSDPNLEAAVYQLTIIFQDIPEHDGWQDRRHLRVPGMTDGTVTCFDLRHRWEMELCYPFTSMHVYVPQTAFDDFTRDAGRERIRSLIFPPAGVIDTTLYHLSRALAGLMNGPVCAPSLLTDQILCAIRTHLAYRYARLILTAETPCDLSTTQIERLRSLLLDDPGRDVRLSELCTATNMPEERLRRAFRKAFGASPHQWRLARKVEQARKMVECSDRPLADIAASCGFADQSHLTRVFARTVGLAPGAYRKVRRAH